MDADATDGDSIYDSVVTDLSFQPFGSRRAPDWTGAHSGTEPTDRGFTGHKHLDALGLIHMNGRVYDPAVGRFLSPDVVVQGASVSQGYNRYSYTQNGPLQATDPSGYMMGTAIDYGFHNRVSLGSTLGNTNIQYTQVALGQWNTGIQYQYSNVFNADAWSRQAAIGNQHYESINMSSTGSISPQSTSYEMSNFGRTFQGAEMPIGVPETREITEVQADNINSGNFIGFWKARWDYGKDPFARVALTGWGKGDYVNASKGDRLLASASWAWLEDYVDSNDLPGLSGDTARAMQQIGQGLAERHARMIGEDDVGIHRLLSPQQGAGYHHREFRQHRIPESRFGGTIGIGPARFSAGAYDSIWYRGCDAK